MRVSREQAAENHERIVAVAGALFREKGYDGIGVADIMQAADLTHGGFYGHFKSKSDLAALASRVALAKSAANWDAIRASENDKAFAAIVTSYLTPRHRDNAGKGCVLAALGADAARQEKPVRTAFREGLTRLIDILVASLPGSKAARRRRALAAMAQMVGAIVLSRAVDDTAFSDEILAAARHDLLARGEAT